MSGRIIEKNLFLTSNVFCSPAYFPDVVTLLNGMNCERYIPNFAQARVSLEEFLTISDERLQEIGIKLPFHRKLIQDGLVKFVVHQWSPSSLFNPIRYPIAELGYFDIVMIVADLQRHMLVMTAHLHWVQKLQEMEVSPETKKDRKDKLEKLSGLQKAMKQTAGSLNSFKQLFKKTYCVQAPTRPLLISKNKKAPKWSAAKLALIAVPCFIYAAFKLFYKNK